MKVVIVGNGVAGMEAALTLREREPGFDITIVSEESDHFFSRTALMYVLSGQLSHKCIEPRERDAYERLGLKRVRDRAIGLDTKARVLKLRKGGELPFDQLIIACGSRPRSGPWPGSDLRGVGHFVTMQDLEWLELELMGGPSRLGGPANAEAHLPAEEGSPYARRPTVFEKTGQTTRSPSVIGGGLIGIEVIETMLAKHLTPHFFIREDWFWPIAVNNAESTWIAERMKEHGVQVHLEHDVTELVGADGQLSQIKTEQGTYDTDLCVITIGVVPNTSWLADSGLELQERGGAIVVGDDLQTNVPGIFACGDCAAVRWFNGQQRPETLWYTGRDQGRIVARRVAGEAANYRRGTWYNSAKLMDVEYTTAGLVNMRVDGEENWLFEEKGQVRSTTRLVHKNGQIIGANFLGRRWDHEYFTRWIDQGRGVRWVAEHINEARFDTEFVPPLDIPKSESAKLPERAPGVQTHPFRAEAG